MGATERLSALDLDKPGFLSASHLHRYALAAELCSGMRVLDLGCGIGYGSAIIAERAASVLGVDNDGDAVQAADEYEKHGAISFEQADAYAKLLRTGKGDFDAVVMLEALEHVPDPDAVLGELARLAGDGVSLLVSVPNSLAFSERNEFHLTDFGVAEAQAAFAPFSGVQWLYQYLSEGSLLVGDDPAATTVELVGVDVERAAANTFIALVGFEQNAVAQPRTRHDGILTANDNAYMLQLEAANRLLTIANRQLGRGIYGKFDAAAAAAEAMTKRAEPDTLKRVDELENRAWILQQERDRFLAERDALRADLARERAWADAGRYHAVDVLVAGVKRTPVVAPAARGARWAMRRARKHRTELPGGAVSTPPAIVVDAVGKTFRRPQEQMHTFKERALHPFRRAEFDRFRAVESATFHVTQGECFGIVGRNGSGKSTLLKLMAGIYQASEGEIWVNGRMSTFIELGVGFNPDLAARDNVVLNGIMLGLTPSEARERYERVIEFSELGEFETVKLKNYSSGMHVRLAFAVMIQVDADVLLIDEVLAVGDAAFQQKCFDQFNRLRDEGKTIVLVTHDMGAVHRFCHRAMLMERGKIVTSGEPDIVGEHYLEHNFQPEKAAVREITPLDERFGDGAAQFTHLWIQTPDGQPLEAAPQGKDLTIKATVRFDAPVSRPSLGLVIEDEQHVAIFATSTNWTKTPTGDYQAGDIAQLTVTLPNVLSPGRYYITPQISHSGTGDRLIDRYPRMISFMVLGTVVTGAAVQPEHDLSVTALDSLPD